jgi:nucleotide-binding universal stress UspA family protein
MKKILFLTDFSATAKNAYIYALNLANATGAEITTLHVYSMPDIRNVNLPESLKEVYESIELNAFENYKDSIPVLHKIAETNDLSHVNCVHVMIEGEPISAICEFAQKEHYDMLIMGTKGASGLREIFLGSVAAKILDKATIKVMAIPEDASFDGAIDNIVFTTEYHTKEIVAFNEVVSFAKLLDSFIHCVHFDLSHTDRITNEMETWKKQVDNTYSKVQFRSLDSNDMEKTLTEYCTSHNIDVVIMLTHKRSFFQRLFKYSITKKMFYHLKIPILSIPAESLKVA